MLITSCYWWAWEKETDNDTLPKQSYAPASYSSWLSGSYASVWYLMFFGSFVDLLYLDLNIRSCFCRFRGDWTPLLPLGHVCAITQWPCLLLPGDVAIPDVLSLPCFPSHPIHQGRITGRMQVQLWVMVLPPEHLISHLLTVAVLFLISTQARGRLSRRADAFGWKQV